MQLALQEQAKLLDSCQNSHESLIPIAHHGPTLGNIISAELISAGVIESQMIDVWQMSLVSVIEALHQYNNMAIAIPFSILIETLEVRKVLRRSPVLVLSAILVSPNLDPSIAKRLDHTFHRVLMDQAMVQGKQNFDILGGLITYLLWFHHRYDPETQQFFQYLQLAKAMVEDLQVKKFLDSGASTLSDVPRISVARMLVGLSYVDQGTMMLDTIRHRTPISINHAQMASRMIASFPERPIDVYANAILGMVCNISINPDSSALVESNVLDRSGSSLCYDIVRSFSEIWHALRRLKSSTPPISQTQLYVDAAAKMKILTNIVCQQPHSYLQTMTIIEWAYLLTVLVKMPYLERCIPHILSGHTNETVARLRSKLMEGFNSNTRFLQHAKHLWWLEGVLSDAVSILAQSQDTSTAQQFLNASTYELLEQLTERLTGFRKGVNLEQDSAPLQRQANTLNDENFDYAFAQWIHLDQV